LQALDALAVALGTSTTALLSGLYPWDEVSPPAEPPAPPHDGRKGRKMRSGGA
jgi:hypothetical protein